MVRTEDGHRTTAWRRRPHRRSADNAPRIGLRGCATAAKRQGHALFEAKVLLFVKPWRRGAVIGEHLVISVEVTSE